MTGPQEREHLDMKKIAEAVENGDGVTPLSLVGSAVVRALQDSRTDYKRGDLMDILPAEYWQLIERFGPPDPLGDPRVGALKAAICLIVCDVASNSGEVDDDLLPVVETAKVAEHVWMRCFDKLSRAKENGDGS